jgi:hypothetical protein
VVEFVLDWNSRMKDIYWVLDCRVWNKIGFLLLIPSKWLSSYYRLELKNEIYLLGFRL